MRGLHWFRNDLRLRDNRALVALSQRVDEWLPVFVLDSTLLARHPRTRPRTRFLLDGLARLEADLAERGIALQILEGRPEREIPRLADALKATLVSWNVAPTPFGQRRDARVEAALGRVGAACLTERDHVVFGPEEIRTKTGGPYSVYTPYRRTWWDAWHAAPRLAETRLRLPRRPIALASGGAGGRVRPPSGENRTEMGGAGAPELPPGGEAAAARRLAHFLKGPAARYAVDRDRPDLDGTSRLSPHLRFGTISIRRCLTEGLEAMKREPRAKAGVQKWLDELVWREFYHAVLANAPRVLVESFRPEYDAVAWRDDAAGLEAWQAGRTGYPFVDAGMRQLAATGWMHNRVRMVVASFLTKHLLIDWRRGERFFFERLVDGDPASNNGGWQWAASTGTDAQPWFRIFNPIAQGRRFDPEGRYVARWVPELQDLPKDRIHEPWRSDSPPRDYPRPIVDHKTARERALSAYRRASQAASSARTRASR
ncbi:MAG: deoxyribodipyrimidine photo-lyase [Myxococcota bacterium]